MKAFLVGIFAAIAVAIVTGFALDLVQVPSATFNSTEHVRLGSEPDRMVRE